jgi:hypothetical protein
MRAPDREGSSSGAPDAVDAGAAGERPAVRTEQSVSADEQLQDLVLALLLRVGVAESWPDPNDFASAAHRAILQQLQTGPAWPDVATGLQRLRDTLGAYVADVLDRVQARDGLNERVSPEETGREYEVRRLELRKHRLMGQHQALVSALHEEGAGLDIAAHRASYEQLKRLQDGIYETTAEQQRLGVVGTASWSIRRGQEVLGG